VQSAAALLLNVLGFSTTWRQLPVFNGANTIDHPLAGVAVSPVEDVMLSWTEVWA
jgi:hypothetical protein